jgi:hypothetical protein
VIAATGLTAIDNITTTENTAKTSFLRISFSP